MKEYKIIEKNSKEELEQEVNKLLGDGYGWELHGSLVVILATPESNYNRYNQTLTRLRETNRS